MSYALDRVATELAGELKRYNITVPVGEYVILVNDRVIKIDPYTDRRKCKKLLTDLLKQAKAHEAKVQQANQGRLL